MIDIYCKHVMCKPRQEIRNSIVVIQAIRFNFSTTATFFPKTVIVDGSFSDDRLTGLSESKAARNAHRHSRHTCTCKSLWRVPLFKNRLRRFL